MSSEVTEDAEKALRIAVSVLDAVWLTMNKAKEDERITRVSDEWQHLMNVIAKAYHLANDFKVPPRRHLSLVRWS